MTGIKPPPTLCKYCPADEKRFEILTRTRLYLASPKCFNDPFDCGLSVSFTATRKQYERKFSSVATPGTTKKANKRTIRLLRKAGFWREFQNTKGPELLNDVLARLGVICFAARSDNLLMWAHYAKDHTGFCLEFDTSADPLFLCVRPVEYKTKYPVLNYVTGSREVLRQGVLLSKYEDWRYEEEWRYSAELKAQPHYVPFRAESLKRVIVGCKAEPRIVAHIKSLLASYPRAVQLGQMRVSRTEFKLVYEPLA